MTGGTHLFDIARREGALRVAGELRIDDAADVWRRLRALSQEVQGDRLDVDLTGASVVDGAIMSLFVELRAELAARGVCSDIVGASPRVRSIVHLYRADEPPPELEAASAMPILERIGRGTADLLARARRLCAFVGELVASGAAIVRHPRSANIGGVLSLAERAGIDGVPIVLILNFLSGVVMAYQSARQLVLYGANVFVADVVGISHTRELVPLMTGIIMSGRSGAAFAAEIGAMKVSDELDALRTLGLSPYRWLVVPRVITLVAVAPVLTLLGDVVGVLGGAVVASVSLGVTFHSYLAELRTAIRVEDILVGLSKSTAFGAAIALIGCHQGLATTGGAVGVGQRTTATVVVCLFTLVIIDTVFTVFYRLVRI